MQAAHKSKSLKERKQTFNLSEQHTYKHTHITLQSHASLKDIHTHKHTQTSHSNHALLTHNITARVHCLVGQACHL